MADKILGIDPGLSGGVVVLEGSWVHESHDMPSQTRTVSRSRRRMYDTSAFAALIKHLKSTYNITCAAVERVGSSPAMGVASAFSFGHGYGIIHGVLEALNINVIPVEPTVWKRRAGLGSDKKESLKKANAIFFREDDKPFKKDGQAEAALIAWHILKEVDALS